MKTLIAILCFFSCSALAQTKNIAVLKWDIPNQRENLAAMTIAEIGGYEIKYKTKNETAFKRIVLVGSQFTGYELELPTFEVYDVYVAVYDTKGLYSISQKMIYSAETVLPKMKDFTISQKFVDPQTNCTVELLCKIVKF